MPIKKEDYEYHGLKGEKWTFLIARNVADDLDEEYWEAHYQSVVDGKPNIPIVLSDSLQKRVTQKAKIDGSRFHLTSLLVFPALFEKTVLKYQISCKDMHLIIVDSGRNNTKYLLELFLEHVNYLTIMTERPEYFQTVVDYAYESNGLIVEIVTLPIENEIKGNVVLDLKETDFSYYKYLRGVELVFDFTPCNRKHQYIRYKFKEIPILYNVDISINGEKVKNIDLMENVLRACFPLLELLDSKEGVIHYSEMQYIIKRLRIETEWNGT